MARPRKHQNNAQRQADYRRRQQQALRDQAQAKGLPPLPAVSTMPGWTRWNQAMNHADRLVTQVQYEMEAYYDDRSEQWRESERGEDFRQKLKELTKVADKLSYWLV